LELFIVLNAQNYEFGRLRKKEKNIFIKIGADYNIFTFATGLNYKYNYYGLRNY